MESIYPTRVWHHVARLKIFLFARMKKRKKHKFFIFTEMPLENKPKVNAYLKGLTDIL